MKTLNTLRLIPCVTSLLGFACTTTQQKEKTPTAQSHSGGQTVPSSANTPTEAFLNASKDILVKTTLSPPAVFEGKLPCAGCDGSHVKVILIDEKNYIIEQRYEGKSTRLYKLGSWSYDPELRVLSLSGGSQANLAFGTLSGSRLVMLDQMGYPLASDYELRPVEEIPEHIGPLQLTTRVERRNEATVAKDCHGNAELTLTNWPKHAKVANVYTWTGHVAFKKNAASVRVDKVESQSSENCPTSNP